MSPRKRKTEEEVDVDDILDEIDEEEIEDADELDEDDDPTEEKPRRKSSRAKAKKKTTAKAKKEKTGVGTAEVADAAGTDPRTLRVLLRAEFPREEGGHYEWSSLNHPEVKKIIKRVKEGGAKKAKQESLDKLKASKGKKKSSKGTESAAAAKKRRAAARRKKARAAAEDDDE